MSPELLDEINDVSQSLASALGNYLQGDRQAAQSDLQSALLALVSRHLLVSSEVVALAALRKAKRWLSEPRPPEPGALAAAGDWEGAARALYSTEG